MAEESAFEKLHVEDKDKADLGRLLEELNLPPKVVKFVRKNQKAIYIVLLAIIVAIVAWSLYGSYAEKKINQSSSALATAKKEPDTVRPDALQKVIDDFSGTKAAQWATVELAHEDMKNGKFSDAIAKYTSIRNDTKKENPIYPLLVFGIAQAMEMENRYDDAFAEYSVLKDVDGYQTVGYPGMGRVLEMQGETEKALKLYDEYRATFTGEDFNSPDLLFLKEKISNLKSKK